MQGVDKLLEKSPLLGASTFPQAAPYNSEREKEGYGWDFVVVVNNAADFQGSLPPFVHDLNNVGLETYSYFSVEKDQIIVKIRAGVKRLSEHAANVGYSMLLDEHRLKAAAEEGGDFYLRHRCLRSKLGSLDLE